MVVELDTHLSTLAALRAAGVRRVRLYPNGALQSAELYPPAVAAPFVPEPREPTAEERKRQDEERLFGSADR